MLQLLDKESTFLKILFDGYDFATTQTGKMVIPKKQYPIIYNTTYMEKIYDEGRSFLQFCSYNKDGYLPKNLMSKYVCGYYSIKDCDNCKNPWHDNHYILFNSNIIKDLIKIGKIPELEFWVCPSFNENDELEAIGFRISDTNKVHNAFKWLFTCGNNIIYGKNTVNKKEPCYVVEGFRDYVALNESGYNVIGLGSVVISKQQKAYIDTLSEPIILFDNDSFGLQKSVQYSKYYKTAILVGTKEKDAWDAYCKGELQICPMK